MRLSAFSSRPKCIRANPTLNLAFQITALSLAFAGLASAQGLNANAKSQGNNVFATFVIAKLLSG